MMWDSLKSAVEHSANYGFPFSKWETKGDTEWRDELWAYWPESVRDLPEEGHYLLLKNTDLPIGKKSGAVTLKIASGYSARFWVATQNNEYFTDNLKKNSGVETVSTGLFGGDEGIFFTLSGGSSKLDYLSIDIDEVHSGIGNFRLRINEEFLNKSTPKDINNEVYVVLLWATETENITTTTTTTTTGGGGSETTTTTETGGGNSSSGGFDWTDPSQHAGGAGQAPNPEEEEEEEKKRSPSSFWGIMAIGAGLVILVWIFSRSSKGDSSNPSPNRSEGGGGPAE